MRIVVLTAHPEPASFNAVPAEADVRGAETHGAIVEAIDLTALVFDPVLRGGYRAPTADEPDLERLRASLLAADHLVWFFPVWWASVPAIVKAGVDRLLPSGMGVPL